MTGDAILEQSIRIAATPATAFRFFSDPDRFRRWMGEGSGIVFEPNGAVTVRYPGGEVAVGRVLEVVPHHRIAFTWGYEGGAHRLAAGASRVVIELRAIETGTHVTLTHHGLDAEQRRSHAIGWRHYLGVWGALASDEQFSAVAAAVVTDYLAAWAETNPDRRLGLLERCWHAEGVFRDAMGFVAGHSDLCDYIGNAQRVAAGVRLERTGEIRRTHGHIWYPWRAALPDGSTMLTGQNFCELAADGRLLNVVGFWDVSGRS